MVDGWRVGGYLQHQPHDHSADRDPLIALARACAAELPEAAPEPPVEYPVAAIVSLTGRRPASAT